MWELNERQLKAIQLWLEHWGVGEFRQHSKQQKNMGRQNVSRCRTVETKVEISENVVRLMATRCASKTTGKHGSPPSERHDRT